MVHVTFQNLCCRAMLFAQVRTSSQNGKRARGGRGPWPGRSDQTRGAPHSLSSSEQRATGVPLRRKLLKLGVPQRDPDGQQKREESISEQKGDAFVRRQSPGLRKKRTLLQAGMSFRGNRQLLNASGCRGLAMACRTLLTTEQRRQTARPESGAYLPPNLLLRTNRLWSALFLCQYKLAARCGKTLGGCRLKRTSLRGLAGPEAGVKG